MKRFTETPWFSVGMPVAFILFALGTVYFQSRRLNETTDSVKRAEKKLEVLNKSIKEYAAQPEGEKLPTVAATQEEDTRFLEGLKKVAQETGAELVKWTSTVRPAGTEGVVVPGSAPPPELKGVKEVVGDLEVYGDYAAVRAFVQRLETGSRLVNMSNITWRRGLQSGTRLQLTVIRYVTESTAGSEATGGSLVTRSSGGTP